VPTAFTHAIIPFSLAIAAGRERIPPGLLVAGVVASILPDGDVVPLFLGVPYASPFGHRGFTHSLFFAGLVALLGALLLRRVPFPRAFAFLFLAAVSHPLLDALTTGGLGVALLAPFSDERFFAPWRFIRVSPLGFSRFFTSRGLLVATSELLCVWLPCLLTASLLWFRRRTLATAEQ